MRFETFVALRHMRSRKRSAFVSLITVISVLGVVVGVTALCVVLSVMSGFEEDLKAKILGTNAHLVVLKFGTDFVRSDEISATVRSTKGVSGASPFILNEGMISSETNLSGVLIKGILTGTAGSATDIASYMDTGELAFLDDPSKVPIRRGLGTPDDAAAPRPEPKIPGIIIGKELQKSLKVLPGDVINIFSPMGELGPTGPIPKTKTFKVVGIFYSGLYEYDAKFVYLSLREAQKFFAMGEAVTGIEARVKDVDRAREVAAAVKSALGGYPYRTKTWMEMNKNLFAAIKLEKIVMFIILTFIVLVASFNIVSALIMVVLERAKEIAIVKSMGATDRMVMRIFMTEGLVIGVVGTVLGLILGYALCLVTASYHFQLDPEVYYISTLPVKINPLEFLYVALAAVGISFIATIYPSFQAAKLRPVEGLRYE
ncbi:MAG: ABC transporter permease [Deltaproteobacteria bacterium]|nr:ABC transporter permease [Deltaproteobacteria bacterium]